MNNKLVNTFSEFQNIVESKKAVCFYLSTPECNVCKVLKPKILEMVENNFPEINFCYVDLNEAKEISGQLSVFSVPTILVYFEGKETIRVSRNVHLEELREQIERYYKMIF
ncbi:MAG: thioredoxin family protein [Ignavibacteriaceae bacterium]|nr:thioredoxin family protein [Ignavibacterium sp.]MCC6253403.1 thioredoxin family protein [Ignavibacteriaceae bacterium]HRN26647.1 thioredoxin family protein [Ignavibacteriaceae bacterium]HRP91937.1 thioredoxin family protein [Ignavibacteriaceae bacterium]HRQ54281.1 thioredoxin family protein [Ignavibacteriaceae bacterium]